MPRNTFTNYLPFAKRTKYRNLKVIVKDKEAEIEILKAELVKHEPDETTESKRTSYSVGSTKFDNQPNYFSSQANILIEPEESKNYFGKDTEKSPPPPLLYPNGLYHLSQQNLAVAIADKEQA